MIISINGIGHYSYLDCIQLEDYLHSQKIKKMFFFLLFPFSYVGVFIFGFVNISILSFIYSYVLCFFQIFYYQTISRLLQ